VKIQNIEGLPCVDIIEAKFKYDFGPWKQGHVCKILRYDLNKGVFEELNEEGLLINIREIAIVTKVKELAEFMHWLEDENSNEHLYTREGVRVYRIYENTKLIRTLKDLAKEMGIYEKKNL
jgi:hypothetical protein